MLPIIYNNSYVPCLLCSLGGNIVAIYFPCDKHYVLMTNVCGRWHVDPV